MSTPVALIIFNRPDTTARVFAAIAAAAPSRLFVIADGPRPDHPDDRARCAATRAVTEHVNWPCEVTRIYSQENLGCGRGPAFGISRVFEQVDECIILEDDCVPHPSFFTFCAELLEHYRDDERVMMVSGNNFLLGKHQITESYYFNHYAGMWGWATWRRAWRAHQMEIEDWPRLRAGPWLTEALMEPAVVAYWTKLFDRIYAEKGTRDIWDAQWYYAMWTERGLAISPQQNLVQNIGFRADATHTTGNGLLGHLPAVGITFPLRHPRHVFRDREADRLSMRHGLPQVPAPEPPHIRLRRQLLASFPEPIRANLVRLYRYMRRLPPQEFRI